MICQNQKNIKIHFAGCEELVRGSLVLKEMNHNYGLFTAFPFICDALNIKHGFPNYGFTYKEVVELNKNNSLHTIQDSGLFSLMFGSYKGKKDELFIEKWYESLVKVTLNGEYKGSVVEVDCQKVLGVEKAWEFREKMKIDLPNNRQINVFHLEDGQKGLERLIEFSDYIAISIPELRSLGKKQYTEKIAHFIKNKKPEIDIHLLGCTENKLLNSLNFCSSADSTSWTSINRYGFFKYNNGIKTYSIKKSDFISSELFKIYGEKAINCLEYNNRPITESSIHYLCCYLIQIEYFIKQYTYYAGDQN